MEYKIQKTSLVASIIALEYVVLNCPFYRKRILVIASKCVNRRSEE